MSDLLGRKDTGLVVIVRGEGQTRSTEAAARVCRPTKRLKKVYRTNVDTISLNVEEFCNLDPLWPYRGEKP